MSTSHPAGTGAAAPHELSTRPVMIQRGEGGRWSLWAAVGLLVLALISAAVVDNVVERPQLARVADYERAVAQGEVAAVEIITRVEPADELRSQPFTYEVHRGEPSDLEMDGVDPAVDVDGEQSPVGLVYRLDDGAVRLVGFERSGSSPAPTMTLAEAQALQDLGTDAGAWGFGTTESQPRWLHVPLGLLPLLSFVFVVAGPKPQAGNRWFWFWVAFIGGVIGIATLAVREMVLRDRRPVPADDARWSGARGFVVGLLMAVAGSVLLTYLAELALG